MNDAALSTCYSISERGTRTLVTIVRHEPWRLTLGTGAMLFLMLPAVFATLYGFMALNLNERYWPMPLAIGITSGAIAWLAYRWGTRQVGVVVAIDADGIAVGGTRHAWCAVRDIETLHTGGKVAPSTSRETGGTEADFQISLLCAGGRVEIATGLSKAESRTVREALVEASARRGYALPATA